MAPTTLPAVPNAIKDPSNLGNVLLDMGVVSRDRLKDAVLHQMADSGNTHLGQVLVSMGAITHVDLEAALTMQECLRKGDILGARMVMLDFQTRRIDRSVTRSTAVVEAGMNALDRRCGVCPLGLPECLGCPEHAR
jgi:hypothetical protein